MNIKEALESSKKHLSEAYDAIEEKGGEVAGNKNIQNLSSAINSIKGGGGDVVNAIIEEYKAQADTIDVNTFVEFVQNESWKAENVETYVKGQTSGPTDFCGRIEKIDDNRVLLACDRTTTTSTVNKCVVAILKFEGDSISFASDVVTYSGRVTNGFAMVVLNSSTALTTYVQYSNSTIQEEINFDILSLSDSGVTVKAHTIRSDWVGQYSAALKLDAVKFSDTKAIVVRSVGSQAECSIVTVSGSTLSYSTSVTTTGVKNPCWIKKIDDDNFLLFGSSTDESDLYAICVVTKSGTSINISPATSIAGANIPPSIGTTTIPDVVNLGKNEFLVLLTTGTSYSNRKPTITKFSVSGQNITVSGTVVAADPDSTHDSSYMRMCQSANGGILLIALKDYYYPYLGTVKVGSNDITISEYTELTSITKSSVISQTKWRGMLYPLPNNKVFYYTTCTMKAGGSGGLYTAFLTLSKDPDMLITPSVIEVQGLTKTLATTSVPGEVWVIPTPTIYNKISAAANTGTAASLYPIGTMIDVDTEEIVTAEDPAHLTMKIVGYSGVIEENGTQKTGRPQLLATRLLDEARNFDDNGGTEWRNCTLRTWLNQDYFNTLPESFKNSVKTSVVAACPKGSTSTYDTQDKLYLLSATEVGGIGSGADYIEGTRLSYFSAGEASNNATALNNIRIAYDSTGTACIWWLRTVTASGSYIWDVRDGGTLSNSYANLVKRYVRPACNL